MYNPCNSCVHGGLCKFEETRRDLHELMLKTLGEGDFPVDNMFTPELRCTNFVQRKGTNPWGLQEIPCSYEFTPTCGELSNVTSSTPPLNSVGTPISLTIMDGQEDSQNDGVKSVRRTPYGI